MDRISAFLAALAIVGWAFAPAQAATVHVTGSISDAILSAQPGDTILAHGPAVYFEHVVIDKRVRLIGTNSPAIDAGGRGTSLTITAAGAEVRGFSLRNSGGDLGAYDSLVMITASGVAVSACRLEGGGFGIYLRGASDCVISGNEIRGNPAAAPAKRGNGIHLWKTRRNQIVNNSIHDTRDGIYLSYADDTVIAGNRVWHTRFGIHYMYSHQNRLLSNSLTRNAVGATLMFSRQSTVEANQVHANRRHGMVFKQLDNSRILRNVVSGHNRGLFVQQAVANRFEGNIISTNDIGLYLSNGSEQNVFVGNSFIHNTDQVWQPPFEREQGRRGPNAFHDHGNGNYWSDYTGADRDRDGRGDTPYHETDVFGRIVDRYPEARVLALSPAVALLRKGEELLPLLDTDGVTDLFPSVRPPVSITAAPVAPIAFNRLNDRISN